MLTRATAVLGASFMIGSMTLAINGQRGTSSILSGVDGPGIQPAAPLTAPVESTAAPIVPEAEPPDNEAVTEVPAEPQ